jgi:hypothetical protein
MICVECGFRHTQKIKNNLYYCYACKAHFLIKGDIKSYHLKKVFVNIKTLAMEYQLTLYLFDVLKILSALKNAKYHKHHAILKKFVEAYAVKEGVKIDYDKTKIGVISMKELLEND